MIMTVARLVFSMLQHDWIPGLCLVLSLAAVLCPLLLVLGLKHGTVTALRQRLLRDPVNLELRPLAALTVDADLLQQLRAMAGASFVLPTTRLLGSSVILRSATTAVSLDLQPTAIGDPLLASRGIPVPIAGEIVLTSAAAMKLGVTAAGATLIAEVSRFKGTLEKASVTLRLAGILSAESTGLTSAYVPLAFQSQVEQFKDGQAVPELQWPGSLALASPEFDGIAVFSAQPPPPSIVSRLCLESGFSSSKKLQPGAASEVAFPAQPGLTVGILCFNDDNPQGGHSVAVVRDLLRGHNALALPWNQPMDAVLNMRTAGSVTGRLQTHPALPIPSAWQNSGTAMSLPVMHVHPELPETATTLRVSVAGRALELPVQSRHDATISRREDFLASAELTGVLRLLRARDLAWDQASHSVLLGRRAYSSFRMYARNLEDVEPLRASLSSQGIECRSESMHIARVANLDRDLSLIFWLISIFGMGGAAAALALSLYGAVERRRRDYGMLRVLGLRRGWLLLLPLLEAVLLAFAAFSIGAGGFQAVAGLINRLFSKQSVNAEAYCSLPTVMLAAAGLLACLLAALASLGAAIRLTTISPADAIRSS
jgi:putative ABC transport system permease protein